MSHNTNLALLCWECKHNQSTMSDFALLSCLLLHQWQCIHCCVRKLLVVGHNSKVSKFGQNGVLVGASLSGRNFICGGGVRALLPESPPFSKGLL